MRSCSHRSSSTFSTGMLEAARVSPVLRRRVASSRPRLCGIETMRGADIPGSRFYMAACSSAFSGKKSTTEHRNFPSSDLFLRLKAEQPEPKSAGGGPMSLGTIILIILVIALLGGFSGIGGGPFYGTGYYGGGGLGLIVVILLILLLLGRL